MSKLVKLNSINFISISADKKANSRHPPLVEIEIIAPLSLLDSTAPSVLSLQNDSDIIPDQSDQFPNNNNTTTTTTTTTTTSSKKLLSYESKKIDKYLNISSEEAICWLLRIFEICLPFSHEIVNIFAMKDNITELSRLLYKSGPTGDHLIGGLILLFLKCIISYFLKKYYTHDR